jgi:hypothetical protein
LSYDGVLCAYIPPLFAFWPGSARKGLICPGGAPGLTPDGHENLANVDTSEASRGRIGVDDEVKVLSIDDKIEVLGVDNKVEIHPSCCLLLLFGLPVWPSRSSPSRMNSEASVATACVALVSPSVATVHWKGYPSVAVGRRGMSPVSKLELCRDDRRRCNIGCRSGLGSGYSCVAALQV